MSLQVDFSDRLQLASLMRTYGHTDHMFFAENENGESMIISVRPDSVKVETLQRNGWTRINIYHSDGTTEEIFRR